MNTRKISLLDSTLREGEQALGVCFSLQEKIEFAKKLTEFGVELIEIGHPGISLLEETLATNICSAVNNAHFLVHARACREDILAAKNTGAEWVGIWASYNDTSLETKFNNKSREWIKNQVIESISLAKELGLKVRFTIEDASRTSQPLIGELGLAAVQAGCDRISLADTVGTWHPNECAKTVKHAVECFQCEIEVHLHNDMGLAHANAIAAIEAGASVIDVSILGVGERAGICDLVVMAHTLQKFYHHSPYQLALSSELSRWLSRIAAFTPEPHHPFVGKHVFKHTSKYHIKAAQNNPEAYESLVPNDFGGMREIALNQWERKTQQRLSNQLAIKKPFIKGSSELKYHRDGVGSRWVLMDNRIDKRSSVYIIERVFEQDYEDMYEKHVDAHAHHCDSVFVFMGDQLDGSGLTVSVTFETNEGQYTEAFSSPASVFIPAYVTHHYAYVRGKGRFLNFVLSPDYNSSLA